MTKFPTVLNNDSITSKDPNGGIYNKIKEKTGFRSGNVQSSPRVKNRELILHYTNQEVTKNQEDKKVTYQIKYHQDIVNFTYL